MNRKGALGIGLFAAGLALSFVINLFSSENDVQSWYKYHRTAVLVCGLLITSAGFIVAFLNATSEAKDHGEEFHRGSVLGAVFSSAITWGVGGAVIGLITEWVLGYLAHHQNAVTRSGIGAMLRSSSPLRVACLIAGSLSGSRFKYMYTDRSDVLTISGMIAGAVIAFATATYFYGANELTFASGSAIDTPVAASALVAGSIGGFAGLFKPNHERRGGRRDDRIKFEREQFEVLSMHLSRLGYTLHVGKVPVWIVDLSTLVTLMLGRKDLEQQLKQIKRDFWYPPFDPVGYVRSFTPYLVIDKQGRQAGVFNSVTAIRAFIRSDGRIDNPALPSALLEGDRQD